MADFRKPAQGALKAIQAASKAADEKLAKMLSHSGDKALPLVLPRANPSNDFINQQAERVARQMMGEHVTTGKDTTNLAGRSVKESQRVKGLDYKLSPTGTVAKEAPYIPRKGDVKVAFPGDQTVSNKTLDEVNGFPIDSVQEGGAYYGLGQRHLADPEFWKSTETPAKAVQGKVDRVAELYQPERVIGSHLAMGQMSNNFAMHFADANLRAIDWSKAKPNKIDTFDSIIAYGYKDPKTGERVKFPNWPGLADREGALAAMKEDSNLRKWFNNRMKTPTITEPLGLPNGLDIQYAITEPRIRDMEINMTGLMTGELKPKALVEAAGNPHNTYTHRILGEAGGPQEVLTPFVIDFPDAAQHIASTKRPSDFTGTIQKVFPHQIVDDQYVNQYNQYRQRIKELTGQKKGGAVERKETAEEMDKFHKCFNMHKAFGGAVVKKVDGGKIAKGVMGAFDKASKAADAAMAGSKALPSIERDANLAKMLDKSKVKNKAYHATDQDVKRFDPKADKRTENKSNIAGWMTNDPEFANDFASQKFRYWKTRERPWEQDPNVPEGANIMPVHLSIENPFYATDLIKNLSGEMNMDEANAVAKALGVGVDELLGDIPKAIKYKSSGKERDHTPRGFDLVKSNVATDAMKRLGHDGVIAIENGSEVYAPFKETQIKSATGNRGTYDLNDPDINKARGGGVHMVEGGKLAKGITGALTKASKMADAAMAEANLKKMLDPSAVQMRLYHGTTATEGGKGKEAIRRLKPSKEGALGSGVYMTPNTPHASSYTGIPNDEALELMRQGGDYSKKMADQFMADRAVGRLREGQAGGNMLPVYAQIKNPLIIGKSGRNIDPAADALMGLGMDEASAIKLVERAFEEKGNIGKQIQSRAQAQGYDGIMQYRGDELSEVVSYNPNAIKSAIGNQGTYDLTSPDLSKAEGGAMLTPTKKTQGFEEEKPMDKSVLEKMHKAVKEIPKLPTSPLGAVLNLGYEGYKYFSGKDPVGDFQKEVNRKLNPKMDTGSAPAQEFEKFAKGGRVQESPEEMARFHKCFAMHKAFGGAVKKPQKFDDGGIASPEESSTPPPDGEKTKAGLMAEFLAKMAKDQGKEELSSLKKSRAATDLLNRGVLANNPLSAGVDLFNLGLGAVGMGSEKPFLGSEYVKDLMNQYGVTSGEERPMMETALSFASPTAMIKGAMKATDAAKKAPELMKKASDAFTSSKMSPLATEAKTASAGKPTGATYATKQEGPFFRVSPTTLDTSKAKTRGIREADELQSPAPLGGGAGSIGRETPQLLSSEEVGRIIADPVANEPLNIAKKYTQETQGVDFGVPNIPESSLAKQSAIGRAQQLAVEGSPEYKTAVFDAYAKQMPDVLEQAGAKNYDDLMEKAYRQMAKETDDQFKILPYNFSYHRAGEGNYNGAMDMASDVHGNKHLYVYQGGDKHDFLNRIDPASGLNENEKFRAVHDLLGHAIYGNQFGPKGEEMAWAVHSQMYSPLARLAMTAETRGQNSMVNYSPLNANLKAELAKYDNMANEARRKGDEVLLNKINAAKRQAYAGFEFAPNKAVLLPPEFLSPQYAGGMPDYLQVANRPAKGTETQSALTHFSNDPNLQMLDPKRYGTGIKGAEAERLRDYAGGVKDRSYFYMGEPGLVAPEAGLGVNRYRGEASSLYDITQDPLNFQTLARESNRTPFTAKVNQGVTYPLQDANDIERLVKEYGYEGMANPKATKPMAIMFKETPVRRQARGGLTLMK